MSRGKGFKRPELPKREAAPLRRVERAGVYATATAVVQRPKSKVLRNRRLLDLARGQPCLLRVPGVCNQDPATTVACHSNWGVHGKAGARKANDHWSCWGCSACHTWLDQGPAREEVKWGAFIRAMGLQFVELRTIAADPKRAEADRRAAQWAVDNLLLEGSPAALG